MQYIMTRKSVGTLVDKIRERITRELFIVSLALQRSTITIISMKF